MRCFRPAPRRSCGSLVFVASWLWLTCIDTLLLEVCGQPGSRKVRRPLFTPSAFAGSPRQQELTHTNYSSSSHSSPFSSASAPTSAVAADILDSSPSLPLPAPTPPPTSSPVPPETVVNPPLPSTGIPLPPTPLTSAPPSPFLSAPYTTSVVPVRMSAAAAPLPRSAEQFAPILRGVCSIPAFNPCVPLAECVPSVPVIGEATCVCPPGYIGDGFVSGQGCNDINECTTSQNDCDPRTMVCIDTPGSFRCECLPGFSMAPNGRTCLDIDECQNPALNDCNPLTMTCHNLEGTYKCVCDNPQQIMDEITKKCRDLNECEDLGGIMNPCEQLCEDRIEGFRCGCREGYRLAPNGVSCMDIDECADPVLNACDPAGVISRCENIVGGYRCICNEALGFENGPDGVGCVNLDECVRDPYICGGAISCCKDLFPPQRFACTVPLDDKLGHTPALGGVTSYGINAALGGSSLTSWIPSFLGLDSSGTLTFPRGLWNGNVPLPLTGPRTPGPFEGRREFVRELEKSEKELNWRTRDGVAEDEEKWGRKRQQLERETQEPHGERVEKLEEETVSEIGIDAKEKRKMNNLLDKVIVSGRDLQEEVQRVGAGLVRGEDVQRENVKEHEGDGKTVRMVKARKGRRLDVELRGEKEVKRGRSERANMLSSHVITTGDVQTDYDNQIAEVVYSRQDDNGTTRRNSEIAKSEWQGDGNQHGMSALFGEETGEREESGVAAEGGEELFRREKSRKQPTYGNAQALEVGPSHKSEIIVVAGNSSPEEIRERLRQIVRPASFFLDGQDEPTLSRRRLQLLTALKPGSPYLPGTLLYLFLPTYVAQSFFQRSISWGSQLGPIGGIRFGRGVTCPAGFRLGGDLYREKVRTKMKNTFEYLITSNVKTNPDGSRRIVSPQEVATGVLSNTQLVSDEATKWYNEFVKLPSAMAPALHIGSSAAMDIGRQAALQQLLNA